MWENPYVTTLSIEQTIHPATVVGEMVYSMGKQGLLLGIIALVAACSSTGVVPMDQDSYLIGKKDGWESRHATVLRKRDAAMGSPVWLSE